MQGTGPGRPARTSTESGREAGLAEGRTVTRCQWLKQGCGRHQRREMTTKASGKSTDGSVTGRWGQVQDDQGFYADQESKHCKWHTGGSGQGQCEEPASILMEMCVEKWNLQVYRFVRGLKTCIMGRTGNPQIFMVKS